MRRRKDQRKLMDEARTSNTCLQRRTVIVQADSSTLPPPPDANIPHRNAGPHHRPGVDALDPEVEHEDESENSHAFIVVGSSDATRDVRRHDRGESSC